MAEKAPCQNVRKVTSSQAFLETTKDISIFKAPCVSHSTNCKCLYQGPYQPVCFYEGVNVLEYRRYSVSGLCDTGP